MKSILSKIILAGVFTIHFVLSVSALSQQATDSFDIYSGHYSREGNNDSPSRTINSNIFIKIFEDQWIATLYVLHPYATTVKPADITKALEQAKKQSATSAYIRGKFGHLAELATVHIERYGYLEDRLVFECGSLAPCTIEIGNGFLTLRKPGVINEHIIRYNHVVDQ